MPHYTQVTAVRGERGGGHAPLNAGHRCQGGEGGHTPLNAGHRCLRGRGGGGGDMPRYTQVTAVRVERGTCPVKHRSPLSEGRGGGGGGGGNMPRYTQVTAVRGERGWDMSLQNIKEIFFNALGCLRFTR